MASTITHTQTRTVPTGTTYQVDDSVTAATGIATEVFVFKTTGGTFDHVATVLDMLTYPNTQAAAALAGQSFYRQASVSRTFTSIAEAQDFASSLISRMRTLASEYDLVVTAFVGATVDQILP